MESRATKRLLQALIVLSSFSLIILLIVERLTPSMRVHSLIVYARLKSGSAGAPGPALGG